MVTEQTENRTILSSKTLQYKIEASKFYDEKFVLSKNDAIAYYGLFDPTSIFDYASVRGIANASKESFAISGVPINNIFKLFTFFLKNF